MTVKILVMHKFITRPTTSVTRAAARAEVFLPGYLTWHAPYMYVDGQSYFATNPGQVRVRKSARKR